MAKIEATKVTWDDGKLKLSANRFAYTSIPKTKEEALQNHIGEVEGNAIYRIYGKYEAKEYHGTDVAGKEVLFTKILNNLDNKFYFVPVYTKKDIDTQEEADQIKFFKLEIYDGVEPLHEQ